MKTQNDGGFQKTSDKLCLDRSAQSSYKEMIKEKKIGANSFIGILPVTDYK